MNKHKSLTRLTPAAVAALALLALSGCGGGDLALNVKPSWLGQVGATTYDGESDDLLTAGLGKTG
ncbi:MAG TPA: 3-hydroxybutyrate oligomer hydrolase family protein, partial [Burkholderiaceae bacterium]|nr:3-hydroxybutyrate oligomer hydrolase family protein [Burkholderiaceae bacterium]